MYIEPFRCIVFAVSGCGYAVNAVNPAEYVGVKTRVSLSQN